MISYYKKKGFIALVDIILVVVVLKRDTKLT